MRSLTVEERAAYEATIREWFPQIKLAWWPSIAPNTEDVFDNLLWALRKNNVVIYEQIATCVYDYGGGSTVYYDTPAEQARWIIRDKIFQNIDMLVPFSTDETFPTPWPDPASAAPAGGGTFALRSKG